MKTRTSAAPSLRAERPVDRRAGRPAPLFLPPADPAAEAPEVPAIVLRLRERLTRIERERRGIERSLRELLDPLSRLELPVGQETIAQRYKTLLAAELQGANVGIEEAVLSLRAVLGKRFLSDFLRQPEADLKDETGRHDRSPAKRG